MNPKSKLPCQIKWHKSVLIKVNQKSRDDKITNKGFIFNHGMNLYILFVLMNYFTWQFNEVAVTSPLL